MSPGTRCVPPKHAELHGEQLYAARREKEWQQQQFNKKVDVLHQHKTRRTWEDQSDLKRIDADRRQRDQQHAANSHDMLSLRRCKLREKLEREDAELYAELSQPAQTSDERREVMRRRLEGLRADREHERRAFAEKMYDYRWRLDCDELRCAVSQQHAMEVKQDRDAQLAQNQHLVTEERQQQQLHHHVMLEDVRAFNKERAALAGGLKDAEKLRMEVLGKQHAFKERVKVEEEEEADRDAADLAARLAKMRADDEEAAKQQRLKERQCRQKLLQDMAERRRRAEEERHRDLEVEREIIARDVADQDRESAEMRQRRAAHAHDMSAYGEYLREARSEEQRAEAEVDQLTAEQAQTMYERQRQTWLDEQQRRQCLLQEAIDIRKQQVADKLERARRERAADRAYHQQLARELEQLHREEQQRLQLLRAAEREHASDLLQQADYSRRRNEEVRAEAAREAAAGAEAEAAYQQKLEHCIRERVCERPHPWRAEHKHFAVVETLPSAALQPAGPPSPKVGTSSPKEGH